MSGQRDPRNHLPPYLARYCPDPEAVKRQSRLWIVKARTFLSHWLMKFCRASARGWRAIDRTGRLFLFFAVGLVLLTAAMPAVVLWGVSIPGLLIFASRIRRWRELDRRGRLLVVCGNLASVVALVLAIGGSSDKPGDETRNLGTLSDAPRETPSPPIRRPLRYTVTDLGTLGGGESNATAINNNGQVVGRAMTKSGDRHAFLWQSNTGMQDLGTLGGTYSLAIGINNKGQVVGRAETKSDGERAFLWQQDTGMRDISTLGGTFSDVTGIAAFGISDGGQVVGVCKTTASVYGHDHAFLWRSGIGIQKVTAIGEVSSDMIGINNRGQIVGEKDISYPKRHNRAFLWEGERGIRDLGTLGGDNSGAFRANNKGQVVGCAETKGGEIHPVLWDSDGSIRDLGSLPRRWGVGVGVSNKGEVVGFAARSSPLDFHTKDVAFLYTDGRMVDLNSLIDPASGWHLDRATAINDVGQIVGEGQNGAAQFHAFLLTPVP